MGSLPSISDPVSRIVRSEGDEDDGVIEVSSNQTNISTLQDIALQRHKPPDLWHSFLRQYKSSPQSSLVSFSLASLTQKDLDRDVVYNFERVGYHQIIAATQHRFNWLHSLLFPRLYDALSSDGATDGLRQTLRHMVHHSLLQLSFVHHGNMTTDVERILHCKMEAQAHREQAKLAETRLRVGFPKEAWQSEEFLTGYFVGCMADVSAS
jgi:hypothetical protein